MKHLVSVLLSVYNSSQFLRQCLDSIINQTLRDIEIICVDDASSNDFLRILEEYEERVRRYRGCNNDICRKTILQSYCFKRTIKYKGI